MRVPPLLLLLPLLLARPAGAEPLVLEGEVPEEGDFFTLPFEVPEGVVELQVAHTDLSDANILDWGLWGPMGFRGWGGGNTEPAVVGETSASRSYLPGPLLPGRWEVVVGRAKVVERPARYRVEVTLRTAPTLPLQPERRPYLPAAPLKQEARWYAGDFHVHSRESGDARPSLDEIAAFARARGLDFVEVSDHNTVSHLDFLSEVQARHPDVLLLPGMELTTYRGHANAIGLRGHLDFRLQAHTLPQLSQALAEQGALLSINHPSLDLGTHCIGCRWEHPLEDVQVGAVEIGTGALSRGGLLFLERALAFWEERLKTGAHVAAVGGSDDHRAGVDLSSIQSPIGSPTTLVYARELSHAALLQALREGRTVVKLEGPEDPMVELTAGEARVGDTVRAAHVTLTGTVTGGQGHSVRWVRNGVAEEAVGVDADPFVLTRQVRAPSPTLEHRYRLEVLVDGRPRTVTSHLYVAAPPPTPDAGQPPAPPPPPEPPAGCGCSVGEGALGGVLALLALALRRRR